MKFIRDLLGKKRKETPVRQANPIESLEQSYRDTIGSIAPDQPPVSTAPPIVPTPVQSKKTRMIDTSLDASDMIAAPADDLPPFEAPVAEDAPASVNIWDLEDDGAAASELPPVSAEAPVAPAPVAPVAPAEAAASAARSPARSRRTKTRLIGFEKSDGAVVDLFNDAPTAAPSKSVKFPVGWLVIADGPGRGESFSLLSGMSQIGRGEDQAVQLDFGDTSVSRSNHAAIVYDADNKDFLLGHGGKSNIVRLNDKPVISNEPIKTGDVIRIGDTVLRFVALCDESFNWSDSGTEEDEDVAIA